MNAPVQAALKDAMARHQRGDLAGAEGVLKKALKKAPKDARVLFMLGTLAAQQGRFSVAEGHLKKTAALEPNLPGAHVNLGNVFKAQEKFNEAAASYRRALELEPDNPMTLTNLGGLLTELGEGEGAEQCLARALELAPNYPDAHVNMGVVRKAQGDLAGAEQHYRRAIDLGGGTSESHCNLGIVLTDSGRFDEAVPCYESALELNPDNLRALTQLGHTHLYAKRPKEAAACLDRSTRRDPEQRLAQIDLGLSLGLLSDSARAKLLEQVLGDHVYPDMAEPVAITRKLAASLWAPDGYDREVLVRFFDRFEPDRVYPADWWRLELEKFGPRRHAHDKMLRAVFPKVYSWSMPTREALEMVAEVARGRRLNAMGAGSGYWEFLLKERLGVEVTASDLELRHRFLEMASHDFASAPLAPEDVLFIGWVPVHEEVVKAVVNLLERLVPGQPLVLVGDRPAEDGSPRTCGTPALFEYLAAHFERERSVDLVSYAYLYDGVDVFRKR